MRQPGPHPSWLDDVVGYAYEFAHTGVLRWLLRQPDHQIRLAGSLTRRSDIDEVLEPEIQRYAGGAARTRPDLAARVGTATGPRWLAVETKVDSKASRKQLERMAAPGSAIVLLAAGATSFQLLDYEDPPSDGSTWHCVGVESWWQMLDVLGDLPPAISEYRNSVAREAQEHAAARRAAWGEGPAGDWRADALGEWAWLDEVGRAARTAGLEHSFWGHSEISGPVLWWRSSVTKVGQNCLYIDVAVDRGRRRLLIKGAVVDRTRLAFFEDAGALLGAGFQRGKRPSEAGSGAFKIVQQDLHKHKPDKAAAALRIALAAVRAVASDLS